MSGIKNLIAKSTSYLNILRLEMKGGIWLDTHKKISYNHLTLLNLLNETVTNAKLKTRNNRYA